MRLFSGINGILRPDYRPENYCIQSPFPSILSRALIHLRRNQYIIEIAKEWFVFGLNMCTTLSTQMMTTVLFFNHWPIVRVTISMLPVLM